MSAGVSVRLGAAAAAAGAAGSSLFLGGLRLLSLRQPPRAHRAALEISLIQFNHSSAEKTWRHSSDSNNGGKIHV